MANYPTSLPSASPATHVIVNDEIVAIATGLTAQRQKGHGPIVATGFIYTGSVSPGAYSVEAVAANKMYVAPFWCPRALTAISLGIEVNVGVAATSMRFGIYGSNVDATAPGSLVLDAGTASTATAGTKSVTISQALSAETLYWLAGISDGAPTLIVAQVGTTYGYASGSGTVPRAAMHEARTYGVLPATFGTPVYENVSTYHVRVGF